MCSPAARESRHRNYRYKVRATRARPILLTPRDLRILAAVHRYRVLHRGQVAWLFFAGVDDEGSSARRRLNLLYQHGYLERIPRFVSPPNNNPGPAYRLAQRGAVELALRQGMPHSNFNYWGKSEDRDSHRSRIGHAHLEHSLLLADIRMTFERQAEAAGAQIVTWADHFDLIPSWKSERVTVPVSANGVEENLAVAPDGYFVLQTQKGKGHFFLEADRGTETIGQQWKRKILAYQAYLTSGKFHQRYHVNEHTGFRVLTITLSAARAVNLHQAANTFASPESAGLFLFTSWPEARDAILTDAWWWRGGVSGRQALL